VTTLYIENRRASQHVFVFPQANGVWTHLLLEPNSTASIETELAAVITTHHRMYGARHRDDLDAASAELLYWTE
jgi:hypothetical protein